MPSNYILNYERELPDFVDSLNEDPYIDEDNFQFIEDVENTNDFAETFPGLIASKTGFTRGRSMPRKRFSP